ncbi:MAG: HAMP domain-containing sensor histidine kinase [Candidatus Limnocylindrales bacterium]
MFHSLRGRLLAAFALLGLALLLSLGGALFVILRDLNQRSEDAALTDALVPFVVQVRLRLLAGAQPRQALETLSAATERGGVSVFLTDDSGKVINTGTDPVPPQLTIPSPTRRGDVTHDTYSLDGRTYVYVAATLFADRTPGGARALVLAKETTAGAAALGDLLRALMLAAIVAALVGIPLATILARQVSRPLERLAAATSDVGRGTLPAPLPEDGPTELAHASAAFNTMTAEVAHARRTEADMLAGLRHDLRTPLTVIGGFAQALQDGTASGAEAARAAAAIGEEAARLERMVDDLGALADLEAGGRPLQLEQLDVAELARAAAARFAPAAQADGQEVIAPPPGPPLPLAADRTALERILGNLVSNALQAAPRPGGHVRIETAALPGGGVLLAVRDDGPGIPAAALPRVFERFFRADPARAGSGTGLGLAIVEEFARAHGGRAFAENLAGGGARVGVVLPALSAGHPAPSTGALPVPSSPS